MDLDALAGRKANVTVKFMGETADVSFDPSLLTQANLTKSRSGSDEDFQDFFCDLVKNWDVKKGNKKVPLTPDGLASIPLVLLKAIFREIMAYGGADSEEGKASSGS